MNEFRWRFGLWPEPRAEGIGFGAAVLWNLYERGVGVAFWRWCVLVGWHRG